MIVKTFKLTLLFPFIIFTIISCSVSDKDCASCHVDVHNEWSQSAHAKSFTNPFFQKSWEKYNKADYCLSCHSTYGIFFTGLGKLSKPKEEDFESGIDCMTCHAGPKGFYGPYKVEHIPHPSFEDESLSQAEFCATCHGQKTEQETPCYHQQFFDYQQTVYPMQNVSCQDCHTEAVERYSTKYLDDYPLRRTRTHNLKFEVKGSVNLDIKPEQGKVFVTLDNQVAGHSIPGGKFSSLLLETRIYKLSNARFASFLNLSQDKGELILEKTEEISQVKNNAIFPGKTSFFFYRIGIQHGSIDVKLYYKKFPGQNEKDYVLIAEKRIEF